MSNKINSAMFRDQKCTMNITMNEMNIYEKMFGSIRKRSGSFGIDPRMVPAKFGGSITHRTARRVCIHYRPRLNCPELLVDLDANGDDHFRGSVHNFLTKLSRQIVFVEQNQLSNVSRPEMHNEHHNERNEHFGKNVRIGPKEVGIGWY